MTQLELGKLVEKELKEYWEMVNLSELEEISYREGFHAGTKFIYHLFKIDEILKENEHKKH